MQRGSRGSAVSTSAKPSPSTVVGRLVLAIGSEATIALLRLTAAVAFIAAIATVTRVMSWLPWEVDLGICACTAGGWMLWLKDQDPGGWA